MLWPFLIKRVSIFISYSNKFVIAGRLQKNILQKLGTLERLNLSSSKSFQNSSTMAYQGPQKVQKVMVQPINLIFRFLQVCLFALDRITKDFEQEKSLCIQILEWSIFLKIRWIV